MKNLTTMESYLLRVKQAKLELKLRNETSQNKKENLSGKLDQMDQ